MAAELSNTMIAGIQTLAGLGLTGMGFVLAQRLSKKYGESARLKADDLVEAARKESDVIIRTARNEAREIHQNTVQEAEEGLRKERAEMRVFAERFIEREQALERRSAALDRREAETEQVRQQVVEQRRTAGMQSAAAGQLFDDARENAMRIASLSPSEARAMVLEDERRKAAEEADALVANTIAAARANAAEQARKLVVEAIERCAVEATAEATSTVVAIPTEEMKGRLIGKDGRNFKAFEHHAGVDLVIDETPGSILISSHDALRREVARIAMQRLLVDGRIHPGRIEEEVVRARTEVEDFARKAAEEAFQTLHLAPAAEEVMQAVGRLRYRHSYSQNVLEHSLEMAQILGTFAANLGVDAFRARRAGLLHDIGKALPAEAGPHALAGAALLRRHGECEEVAHAVEAHHREVEPATLLAHLTLAADAITASRPGARTDQARAYFERMDQLERLAAGFPGIVQAYAIQGGRELRVFANAAALDDDAAARAARDIAAAIRGKISFPGQIRVVVIRETRCIEQVRQGQA